MKPSRPSAKRSRARVLKQLRAIHRWLGIVAAAFLLLLCLTGLALNHPARLGLDSRYLAQRWLLDWYGISGPDFGPSFAIDEGWITLAGSRLYLNGTGIANAGMRDLVGATRTGDQIAVASGDELVLLDIDGDVIERAPVRASLPGAIERIAANGDTILVLSGGQAFAYDVGQGRLSDEAPPAGEISWIEQRPLPAAVREAIESDYRGRGVSLDRFVADLHSGRLLGLSGVVVTDFAALALCVLALSGVLLFIRR